MDITPQALMFLTTFAEGYLAHMMDEANNEFYGEHDEWYYPRFTNFAINFYIYGDDKLRATAYKCDKDGQLDTSKFTPLLEYKIKLKDEDNIYA